MARGRYGTRKYDVIAQMIRDTGTAAAGVIRKKKEKRLGLARAAADSEEQRRKDYLYQLKVNAAEDLAGKRRAAEFAPTEKFVQKGKALYGKLQPPDFPRAPASILKMVAPPNAAPGGGPMTDAELRAIEDQGWQREKMGAWRQDRAIKELNALFGDEDEDTIDTKKLDAALQALEDLSQ